VRGVRTCIDLPREDSLYARRAGGKVRDRLGLQGSLKVPRGREGCMNDLAGGLVEQTWKPKRIAANKRADSERVVKEKQDILRCRGKCQSF